MWLESEILYCGNSPLGSPFHSYPPLFCGSVAPQVRNLSFLVRFLFVVSETLISHTEQKLLCKFLCSKMIHIRGQGCWTREEGGILILGPPSIFLFLDFWFGSKFFRLSYATLSTRLCIVLFSLAPCFDLSSPSPPSTHLRCRWCLSNFRRAVDLSGTLASIYWSCQFFSSIRRDLYCT